MDLLCSFGSVIFSKFEWTATSIDLKAINLRLGELGQILRHHIDGLEVIEDEYKDDCTYKLKVEGQFTEIIHFIIEFGHEYAPKEFCSLVREELLLESPDVTCNEIEQQQERQENSASTTL